MQHSAELRIYLLGSFRIIAGGRELAATAWRRRKAASLVKLLALAPDHTLHRDQIIDLLWPEMELAEAANNLHRTLYEARRILESDRPPATPSAYLQRVGETLALGPIMPWIDLDAFYDAVAATRGAADPQVYHRALDLYIGELLPGDRYEDWTIAPREAARSAHVDLLWHLAILTETRGESAAAIDALRQIVAREPAHEAARASLMRLFAAAGDRHQAIRQFQQLRTALRHELDAAPDPAIERLYQEILAGRHPAGRHDPSSPTGSAPAAFPRPESPTNLPHSLTSFIGRNVDLEEVRNLLGVTRLLTLTGAGGCGKTRLALEAAGPLEDAFPDGRWLVELAALTDAALVPKIAATVFGIREDPDRPVIDALCKHLRAKKALLVLDNCEHLIDACAQFAETVLRTCPDIRILATSREALNIPGEIAWLVPSLPSPDPHRRPDIDCLLTFDAVRLFVERTRLVQPRFQVTRENAAAIAQICDQLDGIPLALELAASRVKVLSIDQIAARLGDCLDLLVHGSRTNLPRHQTLRGAIDWSHALLTEPDRVLFRRLAVFAGGFTLDAAQAVMGSDDRTSGGNDSPISPADILDGLTSLVDKSLLTVHETAGQIRYRLLEPIRQYADQQLHGAGEAAWARERHLGWCLEFGDVAELALHGPEQAVWLDRLETDHDNVRLALQGALERQDAESGLRLTGAVWRFWHLRGHLREGRQWIETFLEMDATTEHLKVDTMAARAKALVGAGVLAITQGDQERARALLEEGHDRARAHGDWAGIAAALHQLATVEQNKGDRARATELAEESLALWRQLGNAQGIAAALQRLGSIAREVGAYGRAATLLEESIELYRRLEDREGTANALNTLGKVVRDQGDAGRAAILHQESLDLHRSLDDPWGVSRALELLGTAVWYEGDDARAEALFRESLALDEQLGDRWGMAGGYYDLGILRHYRGDQAAATRLLEESLRLCCELGNFWSIARTLHGLGLVAQMEGDWTRAADRFREGLRLAHQTGMPGQIPGYLEGLAGIAAVQHHAEHATTLLAAAAALRDALGTPVPPPERAAHARMMAAAKRALTDDRFRAAWAKGAALTLDRAVDVALSVAESAIADPDGGDSTHRAARLSPREREIAGLIARGLTNRQIAAELGTSPRTADTHVGHLLRKLGLTSRAQVAAAIADPSSR